MNIQILLGSTRPGRVGQTIAKWVHSQAQQGSNETFEIIDLATYNLPFLDEPIPAKMGIYKKDHTKAWSEKIRGMFDHSHRMIDPDDQLAQYKDQLLTVRSMIC